MNTDFSIQVGKQLVRKDKYVLRIFLYYVKYFTYRHIIQTQRKLR